MTELHIAGGTEYDLSDMRLAIYAEGCLVGTPMVVIRLEHEQPEEKRTQFVDRRFADGCWTRTSAEQISRAAREMAGRSIHWALLVGDDPARAKLKPLIDALHLRGLSVAVHTGGEHEGAEGCGADWLVILNPNYKARLQVLAGAHEVRFTIAGSEQVQALALFSREFKWALGTARDDSHVEWCVHPANQNGAVDLCVSLATENGYRVSGISLGAVVGA